MRTCVVAAVVVLAGTAQACVPLYGQCGGMNYTGVKCCEKGSVCVVANPYYSQCVIPTPTATPTTAKPTTIAPTVAATTAAPTKRVCSALYAQCGGMGWTGATCCQKGSVCVVGNPYYSQCVMPTPTAAPTAAPTKGDAAPTEAPTTAAPTTPAPSKHVCSALYAQCGGMNWTGPNCCQKGSVCVVGNPYYSQCVMPTPTATPTTPKPTAAPTTAAPTAKPTCSKLYDQCGGKNWTGPTCCVAPATCKVQYYSNGTPNLYYSQCL